MSTFFLLLLCICGWVQTSSSTPSLIPLNWTGIVGNLPTEASINSGPSYVQEAPTSVATVPPSFLSSPSLQAILPGATTKAASISAIEAPIASITPSPVTLHTIHDLQSSVPAGCIPFACKILYQVCYPQISPDGANLTSYST